MQAAEAGTDGGSVPAFAAVDVHYPASGGARAALVLAGDSPAPRTSAGRNWL